MIVDNHLRTARCAECGARCVPGQTHLQHNAKWKKKVLNWDWGEVVQEGFPGWDLTETVGEKQPPFVKLAIRNGVDKSSEDITREFDDVATGRFYGRDFSRDGSVSVGPGEVYDATWWFQKIADAQEFFRQYGEARPKTFKTPAVTICGPKDEPYPDFQMRVAENIRRVKEKCDALDKFTPRCTSCGETCDPIAAGTRCKENGKTMISSWAEEKAGREFYRLGNFAHGAWHSEEVALAMLLDRVRAGEV